VGDWELFDRVRGEDIRLLKLLGVEYICDLMVEQKKVKFGMTVTSSEKVDKERRYAEFRVLSIPYPGCELFCELKAHDYVCDRVHFDWTQPFIDATMDIPSDVKDKLSIPWKDYKMWNLTKITQNYLKLFLYLLRTGDGGFLVHCISGWDRTPLFISLLRLSLWADNLIHQSLNASEILYLTLAYDWLLFGHQLSARLSKGEEILFFCFHFLNQIYADEYSLFNVHRNRISHCDSEVSADGVLQGSSHLAGSTSSLSSTGSSGSVASSSALGGVDADGIRASCHVLPQQSRKKPPFFRNDVAPKTVPSLANADKSSPISVPLSSAAANRTENSPNSHYGSWQLISSSGSPQGSVTLQGSPLTATQPTLTPPHHVITPVQHGVTPPALEIEHRVPSRRQRLDQVRELFLSSYNSTVRIVQEQNATASLAGNIAGMVSRLAGSVDSRRGSVV
jgi:myotubularin-related protein 14